MVEKQENIWEKKPSALVPETINPENSGDIAEVAEKDPHFKKVVDGMIAESREKNETIITNREVLHTETVKKLENRILAEKNALEGAQINIEERKKSKIWWDMWTDHNESLDAAIEAENLDKEQIQKRIDEYQTLLAQAQENYKKIQDDQKLGDEAVKAWDYQKAQEFYNQAARWISHQNQEIQDKIGESTQLAEDAVAQAEFGKEVAGGIRTTAIVVGATLAVPLSGWASLAALWNAVAIGTTAWALGQITEQSWEVIFNNKDWEEAFIDGAKGTWKAALDSALAGTGMMSWLKVAGMAGKAWYGALSTGMIAGWVNTATQSATRTGLDVSQKTAIFFVENWDKIKDLSASEVANVYAEHMAAQWLAPDQIAKNFAFDVATWALGWGVWAKFGPLQEAAKWAMKHLGMHAGEVWSDAALAVLSAHARSYMNTGTWDVSPDDIQKELINALTGSMTGKYATVRQSKSQGRWESRESLPTSDGEATRNSSSSPEADSVSDSTTDKQEITSWNLRPKIQEMIKNAGDEDAQNTKRVQVAEEMIQQLRWRGDKLTPTEQKAILDTHDIKPTGADGKYTAADIAKKTRMLAEAFPWSENKSIREALIRNGVCGEAPKNKIMELDGKSHLNLNLFFAEYPGGNVTLKMKWKQWEEYTYTVTKAPEGDYVFQKDAEAPETIRFDVSLNNWKIIDPDLYGDSVEWITTTMWDEAETPFRANKHSTLALSLRDKNWQETSLQFGSNDLHQESDIGITLNANTEWFESGITTKWRISTRVEVEEDGPNTSYKKYIRCECEPFVRGNVNVYARRSDGKVFPMKYSPTTGTFGFDVRVDNFWEPLKFHFFYEKPGELAIDSPYERKITENNLKKEEQEREREKERKIVQAEYDRKSQQVALMRSSVDEFIESVPESLSFEKDKRGAYKPQEVQRARTLFQEGVDIVGKNNLTNGDRDWKIYASKVFNKMKDLLYVLKDWYTDPAVFKNDVNKLCGGVWKWEDFRLMAEPRRGTSLLSYFWLWEAPIVGLDLF